MNISKEQSKGLSIIRIEGDVDASSSIYVNEAIEEAVNAGAGKILVDCENLNYISSAGLGVFMSFVDEFEEKNITFILYNLKDNVRKVFDLLGLDNLITITSTEQEALAISNEV